MSDYCSPTQLTKKEVRSICSYSYDSDRNKRKEEEEITYLTGASYLPLEKKFHKAGIIIFKHICDRNERATNSNCLMTLTIPINQRYTTVDFTKNFVEDVLNSPGFGRL